MTSLSICIGKGCCLQHGMMPLSSLKGATQKRSMPEQCKAPMLAFASTDTWSILTFHSPRLALLPFLTTAHAVIGIDILSVRATPDHDTILQVGWRCQTPLRAGSPGLGASPGSCIPAPAKGSAASSGRMDSPFSRKCKVDAAAADSCSRSLHMTALQHNPSASASCSSRTCVIVQYMAAVHRILPKEARQIPTHRHLN